MKPINIVFAVVVWGAIAFAGYQYFANPTETQEAIEERHARHTANRARIAELNRQECTIMLRAKAEMIPIEIERLTIFSNVLKDKAKEIVMLSFNIDKKLCEENGIPPSAASEINSTGE